ncbi:hypothetical protein BDR26DRAFT_939441 [Obelidium mucronatum]|nr:hypothetical protein BDR26DRAFT_939441 [Obelidium mucronatum]
MGLFGGNDDDKHDDDKPIWESTGFKILAGAAVVGLGAYAVHNWREKKRHDASSNAPAFSSYQTSAGPVIWRSVTPGTNLPQDALQLGRDTDGSPLYAGRAPIYGGWHIGKGNFEVLCGSPKAVSVVPQEKDLDLDTLPHQPIDAGHEANGERLYVALIDKDGSTQIGKCGPNLEGGANYGFFGKEYTAKHYRAVVLL